MQILIEESEFNRRISDARKDGFQYAIVVAHTFDPSVADKMKAKLADEREVCGVQRMIERLIK